VKASPFNSSKNPVLLIAEIGGNHEGDADALRRMTVLAIESGVDIVKYQLYRGDDLVSPVEGADRNKHFKKFELPLDLYEEVFEKCRAGGCEPMASAWDAGMIDWASSRTTIHKVGSGDLTCFPLIRRLVETGKPVILSTGMASLEEVSATVEYISRLDRRYIDDGRLALLQCTSAYPCPDEDANLLAMETLRKEFGLPVGYSDHTVGSLAVEAAVALGAVIIEKHFTDTREGKTFRDHSVSLTREEVIELRPRLKRIAAFRGHGDIRPTASELAADHPRTFRRSVYLARDVEAGTVLEARDLTVLRPANGISAARFDEVVGRRLRVGRRRSEAIGDSDLE
jgi:N,N'-diacetyllegionaminate synthase